MAAFSRKNNDKSNDIHISDKVQIVDYMKKDHLKWVKSEEAVRGNIL